MAGIHKEPGPTAQRVAASIRHFRRERDKGLTQAELSRRVTEAGQPIPESGIAKTEAGTRHVDVDDLVALALVLGVTPNTLLLPEPGYLGTDVTPLTPAVSDTAEHLWQWAQGERPLRIPGAETWLGEVDHPELRFSIRTRPHLTAIQPPGVAAKASPESAGKMHELVLAVLAVLAVGRTPAEVRRAVELAIAIPVTMQPDEARTRLDGILKRGGRK